MRIEAVERLDLADIQVLVFAGGGNRCWWQAGAVNHWLERGWFLPTRLLGTSGGAAVATSFLTTGANAALDTCQRLFAANARMFEWKHLLRLRVRFAHRHIYPQWVASFLDTEHFERLRESSSRLSVAVTRPAKMLGLKGSVAAATLAYLVDKFVANRIHPRLPTLLGLRQDLLELHACADADEAQTLLVAAAAAQPFIPARRVAGRIAFDGGYTDNAPIPPAQEGLHTHTLVLLTRRYRKLPTLFRADNRYYWQPSRRIPVSMLDCTARATVRDAFALGESDARDAFARNELCIGPSVSS
ncbi:patatin-like phospholipase family protein [Dyella mobilis]|uniref:Patatin-like phospholipase family protein n=1 Tax=Dyella mobilis TaxID=1849582 RepID=A0ABS2KF83_9GAMM|nr:patatin-like phospholipase family protein [Dyella mobilis]MBM7129812.1 patatin-like phospholipase family protein [Dyella mobilis]GLQ97925.1 patatin [Dyella mobilis]